jgi:hypothetical protein
MVLQDHGDGNKPANKVQRCKNIGYMFFHFFGIGNKDVKVPKIL